MVDRHEIAMPIVWQNIDRNSGSFSRWATWASEELCKEQWKMEPQVVSQGVLFYEDPCEHIGLIYLFLILGNKYYGQFIV